MVGKPEARTFPKEESVPGQVPAAIAKSGSFPALPVALLLLVFAAGSAIEVGIRYGWIWGLAAGFMAWAMVSGLIALCACLACGANNLDSTDTPVAAGPGSPNRHSALRGPQ
jgi:hypothetical protein